VQTILSGKLRRYNNLPVWRQLLRPFTIVLPNILDAFLIVGGLVQSLVKLLLWRPDVVFTKGGFVCLPVGLAAKMLGIPLVIHDSDAHPGLTNRVLARWATAIGTGAPLQFYPYPPEISQYVGIPVREEFVLQEADARKKIKTELGFEAERPLVVITGGGLGAQRLNTAVSVELERLLDICSVILLSGTAQYDELRATTPQDDPRYQLHAFISDDIAQVLGAADVVVTRAGATTLLELAALGRPTVVVPNGYLTGGHQLKNAAVYAEHGAVEVLDEHELDANPRLLTDTLASLFAHPARLREMSHAFHALAKPHAARDMAAIILNAAK